MWFVIVRTSLNSMLLTVQLLCVFSSFTRWLQTEPSGRYGRSGWTRSAGVPATPWAPWTHNLLEERWYQLRWQRWTHHSKRYHFVLKYSTSFWPLWNSSRSKFDFVTTSCYSLTVRQNTDYWLVHPHDTKHVLWCLLLWDTIAVITWLHNTCVCRGLCHTCFLV